jgi:hypothetical protein
MTMRRRDLIKLLAAATGGMIPANVVLAQGTSAPTAGGRIVLENEKVRVIEHLGRARLDVCGTGLHSHPPHLTVCLTDIRARVTEPGKEPRIAENKAGDVFWDKGGPHVIENIGDRDSRLLVVELRDGV